MLQFYLLAGIALLFVTKPSQSRAALASQKRVIAGNPQTTKNPASAQAGRADQGNTASQPWYGGAITAAGGLALASLTKSISGLFTSEDNTDVNENQVDEANYQFASDGGAFDDSESYDVGMLDQSSYENFQYDPGTDYSGEMTA
ncbi:MAG: hypothetical protein C5B47_00260 [Verrucomicrobia bacterium]|nr:MAG: hypothetical protein C5B47_00260 [Verrucomicrobiota bacterium]